jgi:hypothetical protein
LLCRAVWQLRINVSDVSFAAVQMVEEFRLKIGTADSSKTHSRIKLHGFRSHKTAILDNWWLLLGRIVSLTLLTSYRNLYDRLQPIKTLEPFPRGVGRMNETSCTRFYCVQLSGFMFYGQTCANKRKWKIGFFCFNMAGLSRLVWTCRWKSDLWGQKLR